MEDDKFLSGYCRRIDGSRTVTVELENSIISHVDCGYEACVYRQNCPIAKQIDALQR